MADLYSEEAKREIRRVLKKWEEQVLPERPSRMPEREEQFTTLRWRIYTPLDLKDHDYVQKLGFPGERLYTRGIYATMYRARLWTRGCSAASGGWRRLTRG